MNCRSRGTFWGRRWKCELPDRHEGWHEREIWPLGDPPVFGNPEVPREHRFTLVRWDGHGEYEVHTDLAAGSSSASVEADEVLFAESIRPVMEELYELTGGELGFPKLTADD